jgi:hypothetical protein
LRQCNQKTIDFHHHRQEGLIIVPNQCSKVDISPQSPPHHGVRISNSNTSQFTKMHYQQKHNARSDLASSISSPKRTKIRVLPELPYTLHARKRSIALTWSALITITSIQVEAFYFLLRYGTSVGLDTALTVPTAILLGFSILAMLLRAWHLVRKTSKLRPVGGKWYSVGLPSPFHIFANGLDESSIFSTGI